MYSIFNQSQLLTIISSMVMRPVMFLALIRQKPIIYLRIQFQINQVFLTRLQITLLLVMDRQHNLNPQLFSDR